MKKIIAILCFSLCFSATANAYYRGAFTFTVAGGYEFFDKSRDLRNSGFPLIAVGYNFNPCWGIEAALTNFHPKARDDSFDEKVNVTLFLLDGIYRFQPFSHFQPYLLAGVGITGLDPNPHHAEARNAGNINAGVGLEYIIHPNISLRAEVRDLYTIVRAKNDVLVDVGITFTFGC